MMMLMSNKKIGVVILLLVLSSFAESKKNKHFDYFRFDLVWPYSFCNQGISRCSKPIPQEFKVHGLWPYMADKRHARISTRFSFSRSEVKTWNFTRSLSTVWPNLLNGVDDIQFWLAEWNKHGIYADMSPEKYFNFGIKSANKYDYLYHSLLEAGIVTPSEQPYPRKVLHDEMTRVVGSSPMIICNQYRNTLQFLSVCICINIEGVALDCPYRFRKCGEGGDLLLFPREETVSLSRGQEDTVETRSAFKRNKFIANQTGDYLRHQSKLY